MKINLGNLVLTKTQLRQEPIEDHSFSASKTDVRKLLTALRTSKNASLPGKMGPCGMCGEPKPTEHQYDAVITPKGAIRIGCQRFTKEQVRAVRKWAFSR